MSKFEELKRKVETYEMINLIAVEYQKAVLILVVNLRRGYVGI